MIVYVLFTPGLRRTTGHLDAKHGRHPVCSRLLCHCLSQSVVSGHFAVRNQGDDTENQATPNGAGHVDTRRAGGGTTAGE